MTQKWRIYYADGSQYEHLEGLPENAPPWGVVDIIQWDLRTDHRYHQTGDFYCFEDSYWFGCDLIGLVDYLARIGKGIVKFGRMIPTMKYNGIRKQASEDDF